MWCAQNMASRIPDPTPNQIARPYSSLSVQDVDVDLTTAALTTYLMGREAYYQTEYLALRNGPDVALVAVRKQSDQPLFSPIVDVRVLAEPAEAAWVRFRLPEPLTLAGPWRLSCRAASGARAGRGAERREGGGRQTCAPGKPRATNGLKSREKSRESTARAQGSQGSRPDFFVFSFGPLRSLRPCGCSGGFKLPGWFQAVRLVSS